jgi:hypothetical protein
MWWLALVGQSLQTRPLADQEIDAPVDPKSITTRWTDPWTVIGDTGSIFQDVTPASKVTGTGNANNTNLGTLYWEYTNVAGTVTIKAFRSAAKLPADEVAAVTGPDDGSVKTLTPVNSSGLTLDVKPAVGAVTDTDAGNRWVGTPTDLNP